MDLILKGLFCRSTLRYINLYYKGLRPFATLFLRVPDYIGGYTAWYSEGIILWDPFESQYASCCRFRYYKPWQSFPD